MKIDTSKKIGHILHGHVQDVTLTRWFVVDEPSPEFLFFLLRGSGGVGCPSYGSCDVHYRYSLFGAYVRLHEKSTSIRYGSVFVFVVVVVVVVVAVVAVVVASISLASLAQRPSPRQLQIPRQLMMLRLPQIVLFGSHLRFV